MHWSFFPPISYLLYFLYLSKAGFIFQMFSINLSLLPALVHGKFLSMANFHISLFSLIWVTVGSNRITQKLCYHISFLPFKSVQSFYYWIKIPARNNSLFHISRKNTEDPRSTLLVPTTFNWFTQNATPWLELTAAPTLSAYWRHISINSPLFSTHTASITGTQPHWYYLTKS